MMFRITFYTEDGVFGSVTLDGPIEAIRRRAVFVFENQKEIKSANIIDVLTGKVVEPMPRPKATSGDKIT